MRRLLLLALLCACTGGKGGDDDEEPGGGPPNPPAPPSPPSGSVTAQPTAPQGAAPPIGVTWHVGFTENVSRAQMQGFFASLVAANNGIWNVSEGQVRVDRIRFFDAVAPGVRASQFLFGPGGGNTANIDILVWPAAMWDVPAGGAVGEGQGRTGRLMVVPANAPTFVLMHEGSHFLFQLTWSVGGLLVDEYQDGVQDSACVMESENLPHRWCSDANHAGQSSQPHACWRQILLDYPLFTYAGHDTAASLPATPVAEYNDTP
jgi:hypothetical protein